MSLYGIAIATLRHLGAALVDQSEAARKQSEQALLDSPDIPEAALGFTQNAFLLSAFASSCLGAANSLQNNADALARTVEPKPGDPTFNPRGKAK